jgi:AcrR family transcriptional regulator
MADPRRARTRGRLLAAARRLIAEKGVAGLRIGEITHEAGVALGSFQNHFADKEELVEAVVRESLAALADEVVGAPAPGKAAEAAIAALRRFVRLGYDDPAFARVLVNLSRGEELFVATVSPFARAALARAVQEGAFEIEDVEVAATAIVAGGLGVIRRIVDGELGPDADAPLARMVLRGFGVAPEEAARITEVELGDRSREKAQVR